MIALRPTVRMLRSAISKSWVLSRLYYRRCGIRLTGRPEGEGFRVEAWIPLEGSVS